MKKRDFIYLALIFTLMFIITACGKDGLQETEYFINDEWRTCSQPAVEPCGATLICGSDTFTCMTNIQMR